MLQPHSTRFLTCLALVSLLVVAGCGTVTANLVTADESVSFSSDASAAQRVIVEVFNGSIQVTVGEGKLTADVTKRGSGASQAQAQADLKNIEVTLKPEGDALHLVARRTDNRPSGNSGASVKLTVPAGAWLELMTSNASVTTTGVTGDLKVNTSNGAITVNGGKNKLNLRTSNAALTVDAQNAVVNAETSNGQVRFKGSLADGEHVFATSNGAIDLTLPAESKFRLSAVTSNGKVTGDFAMTSSANAGSATFAGVVGDNPAVSIKANTSNANIVVHKQ